MDKKESIKKLSEIIHKHRIIIYSSHKSKIVEHRFFYFYFIFFKAGGEEISSAIQSILQKK